MSYLDQLFVAVVVAPAVVLAGRAIWHNRRSE